MIDLSDKVFVITGGNGGIGLGLAEGIAEAGGSVAIWARNEEKNACLLYTSPSPRDVEESRMPSSA